LKIFKTREEVQNFLKELRSPGRIVGFVPTMGALHQGHLSLIAAAKERTDIVVCSIFVNPTQFNDKKDLENYPRPIADDIHKLQQANCDILFLPEVDEMYSDANSWHMELNGLDNILEGEIRPGHYQGVTQIVKKLFDIVKPDYAFFGQKDFQQFVIISYMVRELAIQVNLIRCPIVREKDGLAMSSRNVYLKGEDRQHALALFKTLSQTKADFGWLTIEQLSNQASEMLAESPGIEPEYFEIFNAETFEPAISKFEGPLVALVAARVGSIRIIDNMILSS
jgi:pantoate--beta-alanine ligase